VQTVYMSWGVIIVFFSFVNCNVTFPFFAGYSPSGSFTEF